VRSVETLDPISAVTVSAWVCEHLFVTPQGSAHGRFTRAIQPRNLWAAESSLRELGTPSLEDALAYLGLLAETNSAKLERAAVRWHGRLETEATFLSLAESQLALAALASLCAGERDGLRSWVVCSGVCDP
jgi:hypothetical protein